MFNSASVSTCILCVPSGSISQYSSTSPWSKFNNIKVYNFIKDGLCYRINDDNSSVSVTISDVSGSITIPPSVTYNGKTYSVTSIDDYSFYNRIGLTGTLSIPTSVKSIGAFAFYGCGGLTGTLTIPANLLSLGAYAFSNCSGLKTVNWNMKTYTSITTPIFSGSNGITTFNIGNSVQWIPSSLCYGMSGITSINIPTSVTYIGSQAFSNCTGLKTVNWSSKSDVNYGNEQSSPFYGSTGITAFTFGNSVQNIPDYLCYGLTNLSSITIPSSVTRVGTEAFGNCSSLKEMNYNATNCQTGQLAIASLEFLNIGSTVQSIQSEKAFYNCTNLKKIVCNATTPPTNVNSLTFPANTYLSVPKNVVSVYQQKYADYMNSSKFTRILPLPLYSFDIPTVNKNGIDYSVINYGRTEEKVNYSEAGVYVNLKKQNASVNSSYNNYFYFKNNSLTDLIPGATYTVRPYVIIDGKEYAGYWGSTITVDPVQSGYNSAIAPSSIVLTDNTTMPSNISFKKSRLTLSNNSYESYGNAIIVTGLKPSSYYSGTYSVEVSEGTVNTSNVSFYTPSLTLNNQAAKMLTNSTALLQSFTNLSEEETSCGFNWKRYDAPDEMLGNPVYCPVYDGMMMGTLKNLPEGVYYKYRPFYRASDGTLYYGEWVAFYTGDANVQFDPVAHTYDNARVSGSQSIIQGIAIRGSQEITEQGFEYWIDNTKNSMVIDGEENVTIKASSISKVTATGERMSATLNSLKGNTTYAFRAYVKTASGTTYGELRTFRTPVVQASGDVNGDGVVTSYDVTALYNYLLNNDMTHYSTCDINGDGQVTAADVTAIYDILLGN